MAEIANTRPLGRYKDLSGQQFVRLVAVTPIARTKNGVIWLCRCECGGSAQVMEFNLRRGNSRSCGCLKRERVLERNTRHGEGARRRHSPEYSCWRGMLSRCRDLDMPGYGGDGIRVCARWEHGDGGKRGFDCFLEDMGRKPTADHSIERRDVKGNYEPGNCVWTTDKWQCRNRRTTRRIDVMGHSMSMAEAAEKFGINYGTLQYRLDKLHWAPDRAVSTPLVERQVRHPANR